MNTKRKLAAIVFADIAGYTDQANRDEGSALDVRGRVEKLVKSCTLSHNGRIVKVLGDGAMLEFSSAVDAVGSALDIQDQMDQLNADLQLPEPVLLRVGVHVGEVVEEDNDLLGNAVNIASRVHNMAKPGGICITREVYVQIRPILKLRCDPVDGTASGRLPEPIEVFQIMGGVQGEAPLRRSGSGLRVIAAVLSICALAAIGVSGYLVFGDRPVGGEPLTVGRVAHRLLLPDWVSPGEEFELDAGPNAAKLVVYCGNRRAQTREVRGKLKVKVPADLPTQQTTISVFEEGSSAPLLSQTTQVIRSQIVALKTAPQDPVEKIGSLPTSGPVVDVSQKPLSDSSKSSANTKQSSSGGEQAKNPPSPPTKPVGNHTTVQPPTPGYDMLVNAVDTGDFENIDENLKVMHIASPNFEKAMRAVSLAASGQKEEARKMTVEVQTALKESKDPQEAEIVSLIKSADAMLDEQAGRPGAVDRTKWAQAFAYSINHGTKNFAGLAMVGKLMQEKNFDEAQRALNLLKQQRLTAAENRLVSRFQARLDDESKSKAGSEAAGQKGNGG